VQSLKQKKSTRKERRAHARTVRRNAPAPDAPKSLVQILQEHAARCLPPEPGCLLCPRLGCVVSAFIPKTGTAVALYALCRRCFGRTANETTLREIEARCETMLFARAAAKATAPGGDA
jgi:hypothetical protein